MQTLKGDEVVVRLVFHLCFSHPRYTGNRRSGDPFLRSDLTFIGITVYTFARANQMKVHDYFVQGRRGWGGLQEKREEHEVPCHHNLEKLLDAYRMIQRRARAARHQNEDRQPHVHLPEEQRQAPIAQHIVNHQSPRTTKLRSAPGRDFARRNRENLDLTRRVL